ncbi:MAG: acyl transferase [Dehalococcoidia bacterium]|nr:MAG: acyl transferase [Dehalococcoidia bacterium]
MPLNDQELSLLREIDTPTICNALEIVSPERRARGFTVRHLHCAFPALAPMVGYARTARVRAATPPSAGNEDQTAARVAYYRYIDEAPGPTVMVIEDIDTPPGFGSWWGEVHSNVHRALGALGVVTSGSVRDLDMIAEGFQLLSGSVGPSHAWVQLVDCGGEVNVHGMVTNSGDLIHADRHGDPGAHTHTHAGPDGHSVANPDAASHCHAYTPAGPTAGRGHKRNTARVRWQSDDRRRDGHRQHRRKRLARGIRCAHRYRDHVRR